MPESNQHTFSDESPPRVWLMMGHRAGDNSQVQALGEALGWPFEIKRLAYRKYELAINLLMGPTLAGVIKEKSSALEPPWPDLILSAGRRNEPACRWIQREAAPQRVRLVHMGRPWAAIERFDLIVTTPQYRLPRRENVLHNMTPLHRVTNKRLRADAEAFRERVSHLEPPYIAVVLGGSSGPYSFDERAGRRLAEQAGALARRLGGSLLITTSARTPRHALDALMEDLQAPHYLYRWSKEAMENPYFAFLGLADSIVVTGDSVSMMAEGCATEKPVYLFDLGEGPNAMRPDPEGPKSPTLLEALFQGQLERNHMKAFVYRQTMRFGPQRMTRDIRIVQQNLVDSGHAMWLSDALKTENPLDFANPPPLQCVPDAVDRTRALFGLPPVGSRLDDDVPTGSTPKVQQAGS